LSITIDSNVPFAGCSNPPNSFVNSPAALATSSAETPNPAISVDIVCIFCCNPFVCEFNNPVVSLNDFAAESICANLIIPAANAANIKANGNNGDATRAVRQISKNHPNVDTVRIDVENPNDIIPGARKIEHSLEGAEEFADHVLRNGMPRKGRGTVLAEASAAWQRSEGKDPEGGLNRKGVASYRRENPGSKLSMAVTTKPSKLKPGSKAAKRRKSFCSRMKGMKAKLTSAKTARDPDSRINKSLRKWNC
jgi:hypothetical protein